MVLINAGLIILALVLETLQVNTSYLLEDTKEMLGTILAIKTTWNGLLVIKIMIIKVPGIVQLISMDRIGIIVAMMPFLLIQWVVLFGILFKEQVAL